MSDPFLTLDVREDATDDEVFEAYRKLANTFPAERFPKRLCTVEQAYLSIADEEARAEMRILGSLVPGRTLADLIPDLPPKRHRIGMDTWLEAFGGAPEQD